MVKRRITIAALLLFLLGFPLVGMLYVYVHAHSTMRASAKEFVTKEVPSILREQDYETLYFLGTLTLKNELSKAEFEGWRDKFGPFEGLGELRATRSTVGARADQTWQFVDMEGTAQFSKGPATLHIRAARRSTALMEWRIEEFEVRPGNVE